MQRKRIQPDRKPTKRPAAKKIAKKAPVSFSEKVLNGVIFILAVAILVFFSSMVWRIISNKKDDSLDEKATVEQQEAVQTIIRIEVLNGCGVKGVAAKFTDYLRSKDFDVLNTGNYRNFDVDSSFVIDRRSMRKINGYKLAESLNISKNRVEPILSDEMDIDATLVLGKDYQSLTGYSESGSSGY